MSELKEIKGHEGYLISNEGKLFSQKSNRYLAPQLTRAGYVYYRLNTGHKYAHILVANAFLCDPPSDGNKYEVNHIDHNKENNNVNNLEYVTHSENIRKALDKLGNWQTGRKIGFKISKSTKKKMSEAHKKPLYIYKDDVFIYRAKSIQDAADYLGYSRMSVYSNMRGIKGILSNYEFKLE